MSAESEIIDVENMPLEEWLELVFNPPPDSLFTNYEFPTDKHKEQYIETIHSRTDEEVKRLLLRFLIPSGTLGIDKTHFGHLVDLKKRSPETFKKLIQFRYVQRLTLFAIKRSSIPPWEGITWIMDLLPHSPKAALEGLNAYTLAHIRFFPEGRLEGMFDAEEIIRAKYIGYPHNPAEKIQVLMAVSSREFEHLVERLYSEMGYETQLTPPQKDGGRDVIAFSKKTGKLEQLRIECKHYNHPVGVEIVRALLGVVSDEKVNKGVLVTTNRFTKGAKDFANKNHRLELISGTELVPLMNEYFGSRWHLKLNQISIESQRSRIK